MVDTVARRWWSRAAVVVSALVVAGPGAALPAYAAPLAQTDVSLRVAGVNNSQNTIGITFVMHNEGPQRLTEDFALRITTERPLMTQQEDFGRCSGAFGVLTCRMLAHAGSPSQPGVAEVEGTSTFSMTLRGNSPCGTGCRIRITLVTASGDPDADLNIDNNFAQILDGGL